MALDCEVHLETGFEGRDALLHGGCLVVAACCIAGGQQETAEEGAVGSRAIDVEKRMTCAARLRRDVGPRRLVGAELQLGDLVEVGSAASLRQQHAQADRAVLHERRTERRGRVRRRERGHRAIR
jgi:hypothetical protein